MRIGAIIPARGGSKGLKKKNVRVLGGKPLIVWTLEAARNSKFITDIIISTDDSEIKKTVESYGFICIELRPPELSTDTASSVDVIEYELKRNPGFDLICMLQVTSPLRDSADIDSAFELFFHSNATSCVSVKKLEEIPFWSFEISSTGYLSSLFDKEYFGKRRQDLNEVYTLNGAIYIAWVKDFLAQKNFITERTIPYIMSQAKSIDIDTIDDFEEAEKQIITVA